MTTTIVTRSGKGSPLTNTELDANFTNLKTTADAALPAAGGTISGSLIITSDLEVRGTTTSIDSTTVEITDLNITLAKDATNATQANGAGITIAGSNAELKYVSTGDNWTINKNLSLGDNIKAQFGNDSTFKIYRAGGNSFIDEQGSGNLRIRGSDITIQDAQGNGFISMIDGGTGGTVFLKHNGSDVLQTTSTGIDVTGTISSGAISANAGTTNTVATFTSTDAGAGINLTDNSGTSTLQTNGANLRIGVDEDGAVSSSAIQFRVDGSTKATINDSGVFTANAGISSTGSGTFGSLTVNSTSTQALLINGSGGGLNFSGGNNRIYFGGQRALEGVTSNGNIQIGEGFSGILILQMNTSVQGNLSLSDNNKIRLGSDNDLEIYHDGSNSYITDSGTGNLLVQGNGLKLQNPSGETYINCISSGAVAIRFDDATKLATTSTGIDVTGSVTADGLTVDGTVDVNLGSDGTNIVSLSGQQPGRKLDIQSFTAGGSAGAGYSINATSGQGQIDLQTTGTTALSLDSSQNATFSGTISSGAITSTGNNTFKSATGSGQAVDLEFLSTNTSGFGNSYVINSRIRSVTASSSNAFNSKLEFYTSDTSDNVNLGLSISEAQNVNIPNGGLMVGATTAPDTALHVKTSADTIIKVEKTGGNYIQLHGTGAGGRIKSDGQINFDVGSNSGALNLASNGNATFLGSVALSANTSFPTAGFTLHTNGFLYTKLGSNGFIFSAQNGTEAMRINGDATQLNIPNGSLMIGATTAPTRRLDVSASGSTILANFKNTGGTTSFISLGNTTSTADQIRVGTDGTSLTLSTNYTPRLTIDSSGRVGLGTTSPAQKLHVVGGQARFDDHISIQPTKLFYLDGGGDTFIHEVSANNIAFNSGGGERVRINTTGLGIGITSPARGLQIHKEGNHLSLTTTASGTAAGNGSDFKVDATSSDLQILNYESANTTFWTSGSERVRIDSSGNFTIKGSNADLTLGATGNDITFNRNSDNYINAQAGTSSNIIINPENRFIVNTSDTERLRVDSSGRLGLGTTSPSQLLHVSGTGTVFKIQSSSGFVDMFMENSSNTGFLNLDATKMNFYVGGGSASNLKMSILNSGNVGLGTTSPDATLRIDNESGVALKVTGGAGGTSIASFVRDVGANVSINVHGDSARPQISLASAANTFSMGVIGSSFEIADSDALGSNTRLSIDSSGRLGLGTSSPNYSLDVDTVGHNSTGELLVTGGNSASNDYTQTSLLKLRATSINPNQPNHNEHSSVAEIRLNHSDLAGNASSGNITFFTNPSNNINSSLTQRMVIDSSGRLGLGTSSPASILHISDASSPEITLEDNNATSTHRRTAFQNVEGTFNINTRQSDGTFVSTDYQILKNSSGATAHKFLTGGVERLQITSAGKALFKGAAQTGYALFDDGVNGGIHLKADTSSVTTEYITTGFGAFEEARFVASNFVFKNSGTSTRAVIDSSGNFMVGKTTQGLSNAGFEVAQTGQASATQSGASCLRLNRLISDGEILQFRKAGVQVGNIATVDGDLTIFSSASGHKGLRFGNGYIAPTANSTNIEDNAVDLGLTTARFKNLYLGAFAYVNDRVVGSSNLILVSSDSNEKIHLDASGFMKFETAGSEAARFDSNQRLIIGGTSFGASNSVGFTSSGSAVFDSTATNVVEVNRTSNGNALAFHNSGSLVGSITLDSNSTAYNTSSDARLKTGIKDADDSGEKIDAIQVRQFDWKSTGKHQNHGMIAQELQKIVPEAVSGDAESEEMMGIDYSALVPILVKEIQSLRQRVAQLEE